MCFCVHFCGSLCAFEGIFMCIRGGGHFRGHFMAVLCAF